MNYSFLSRTKILSIVILAFAIVLIGRLFYVQIIHGKFYSDRADRQYVTSSTSIFERGTIYFTRKDGELVSGATQTTGYKLAINPSEIVDIENVYLKLVEVVPEINHDDFVVKASKKNDPYEEIATRLTKEQADGISAKKINGVFLSKEKWRFYPGTDMASNTLGIIGYKGDELAGRYGLERQYDDILSRNKDNPYVNFFAEVFSNINETFFSNEEHAGSVVTTIEPIVQGLLEKTLASVKEKYNVDTVGGIIMDPTDGSIYAISTKPSFDPNDFSKIKDNSVFSNPLVENVFEFGSVVKPLVMAAALDANVLTPDTTYDDKGSVVLNKKTIYNFDKKGRGPNTTMQQVLNQSLNTGMVFVSQKLGHNNMRNYLLGYGLKEKTGIDLPNETSGLLSNLSSPRDLEYGDAAFGQGIAFTPVEIVRALASLSNGGNLVVPHLVKEIKYDDGIKKGISYPITRAKITEKTSEDITRMLVAVMDGYMKTNTGKLANYSIAAKTGTAQVANLDTGGYYEDRHTHSFFGYFPAYEPRFIIFLFALNPKGVQYASQTWTNPFLDITRFLVNYYEVPPDR